MKEDVKNLESALRGVVAAYEALEERNAKQWLLLHKVGKCTSIKQVKALLGRHYQL